MSLSFGISCGISRWYWLRFQYHREKMIPVRAYRSIFRHLPCRALLQEIPIRPPLRSDISCHLLGRSDCIVHFPAVRLSPGQNQGHPDPKKKDSSFGNNVRTQRKASPSLLIHTIYTLVHTEYTLHTHDLHIKCKECLQYAHDMCIWVGISCVRLKMNFYSETHIRHENKWLDCKRSL